MPSGTSYVSAQWRSAAKWRCISWLEPYCNRHEQPGQLARPGGVCARCPSPGPALMPPEPNPPGLDSVLERWRCQPPSGGVLALSQPPCQAWLFSATWRGLRMLEVQVPCNAQTPSPLLTAPGTITFAHNAAILRPAMYRTAPAREIARRRRRDVDGQRSCMPPEPLAPHITPQNPVFSRVA